MFPEKNVIAYSDNLLGSAPIYSTFRLLGFDTYRSYQLWFVVLSAFNYTTAFYFLKYVFKNRHAAVIGALVFAFSLALQSQLTHAQTFPRFAIPLAFLMAVKFGEELSPKYFFLTLFFVVYQIYCGIYLGFMLAVPIAIYLLLNILKNSIGSKKRVFRISWFAQLIACALFNLVLVVPLMLPYLERRILPDINHFQQIKHSIPTLLSYLYSQEHSLVWGFLGNLARHYEAWYDHQLFTGAIASVCLLVSFAWLIAYFVKRKFRTTPLSVPILLAITGLLTFILYLRFNETSAYILLYFLPGFSSMRSMTRIINIELLFFAIATAWVFTRIHRSTFGPKAVLFWVGMGLILLDNFSSTHPSYRTRVAVAKERVANIEPAFASLPRGSVVSYEPKNATYEPYYYQLDAMLLAQQFGLNTINGYTATCPADYRFYWSTLSEDARNHWLASKRIDQAVIHIVKSEGRLEKITLSVDKQQKETLEKQFLLHQQIEFIKSDVEWMKLIEQKALVRNISVDSMLLIDAKWALEYKK